MRAAFRASALTLAAVLLGACGNGGNGAAPAPSSGAVASLAASTSESGEPFDVNDGAFAFNDSTETGEPRSINR